MNNVLIVVSKVISSILIFVLSVLGWKTVEYFNRLPENDKHKPLLAWDVLMLFIMLIYLVLRLALA